VTQVETFLKTERLVVENNILGQKYELQEINCRDILLTCSGTYQGVRLTTSTWVCNCLFFLSKNVRRILLRLEECTSTVSVYVTQIVGVSCRNFAVNLRVYFLNLMSLLKKLESITQQSSFSQRRNSLLLWNLEDSVQWLQKPLLELHSESPIKITLSFSYIFFI
jgi:hypothetical protein